jgi:hypothetical protein
MAAVNGAMEVLILTLVRKFDSIIVLEVIKLVTGPAMVAIEEEKQKLFKDSARNDETQTD